MGRFWGVDPLAKVNTSSSTYSYVLNNPIALIDPDGAIAEPPPNGQVSWVWSIAIVGSDGKYHQRFHYQNVSENLARHYNQSNNSNGGDGLFITETTYNNINSGEDYGHEVRDPNKTKGRTVTNKRGAGEASMTVPLPQKAETVSVDIEYDMIGQEDNLTISAGDESVQTGQTTGEGKISLTDADISEAAKKFTVTITPMDPNPGAPQGFIPSTQSVWFIDRMTYSTTNTTPVYSSKEAESTRSNSLPGEELGGYRVNKKNK